MKRAPEGKIAGWVKIDPKYLKDIEKIRRQLNGKRPKRTKLK